MRTLSVMLPDIALLRTLAAKQVRTLPVGDVLWLARGKADGKEYVLDCILERKRTDDLWASIKSKRFRDQKLRLQVRTHSFLASGVTRRSKCMITRLSAGMPEDMAAAFPSRRVRSYVDGPGKTVGYLRSCVSRGYHGQYLAAQSKGDSLETVCTSRRFPSNVDSEQVDVVIAGCSFGIPLRLISRPDCSGAA